MTDATQQLQSQIDSGNYSLDGFDGAGIKSVNLKHAVCEFTSTQPVTLYMLPMYWPKDPTKSQSLPMFNINQRPGLQRFERVSFSDKLVFDGGFTDRVPWFEANLAKADPMGIARNLVDQITDDAVDIIESFYFDSTVKNLMGTAVSLTNVGEANIYGRYYNIGNKIFGCAYSQAENPMFINLSPTSADWIHSAMDFSAPGPNKAYKKKHIPFGYAHHFAATNVYGRSKTAAWWSVELDTVYLSSVPWPSPVQYSGFTTTEPMENFRAKNCYFKDFLRAGLELRNTQGTAHIDGVTTKNSLYTVLLNGSRPITYGAYSKNIDCGNSGIGHVIYENTKDPTIIKSDLDAAVLAAKNEALTKYGAVINFPV